jgi:hypothetical protein
MDIDLEIRLLGNHMFAPRGANRRYTGTRKAGGASRD